MKALSIMIAAAALLACSAQARLGETEEQIVARYGPGKTLMKGSEGSVSKSYASGGLRIFVTYINGKSQSESYLKLDDSAFSDSEVRVLLDANAAGKKWADPAMRSSGPLWQHESGDRIAHHDRFKNAITIFLRSGTDVIQEEDNAAAKQKLKNF